MDGLSRARYLLSEGFFAEALPLARRVLTEQPESVEAHLLHGRILYWLTRMKDAEVSMRRALALQPDHAEAHFELACLLEQTKRFVDADSYFSKAALLDPALRQRVAVARGTMHLARGKFAKGWRLCDGRGVGVHPARRWHGEDLNGVSILLRREQGFGDQIQFARYAPILQSKGARVSVAPAPELRTLFRTLPGTPPIVEDDAQGFDYWTPMLSVPRHLGTDLHTIPADVPYLAASPELVATWSRRLPQRFKVGLAWKGNLATASDQHRSLPDLTLLRSLWTVPGISFVSLQKGRDEIIDPPSGQPIMQLGREIKDFSDTAAIIAQLDLVISVDTAAVHLAGALNKPCWMLLQRFQPDWRWLIDRSDSPWYPSLRIFRQGEDYDWRRPIAEAAAALADLKGV